MESMNKFKVLTVIIVCMFLFVVAAIYTNTKDVTNTKTQDKNMVSEEQIQDNLKKVDDEDAQMASSLNNVNTQIDILNKRVDELSLKFENNNQNSTPLNCRIYGTLTPNGVEQISPDAVLQEAKVNNNDIVITCKLQ